MTIDEAVRCNKQLRLFMIAEDAANDTNRFLEESYDALDMAIEALEKQKTGKWIRDGRVDADGNIHFYCSNCKRGDTHAKGQKVPFCWWCGARMEVSE